MVRINSWAKQASRGLIPRIVEQLDAEARFVLANVVYFNGAWASAFDTARTANAPFTRVDGSKRDVAMMDATMAVEFAEFDDLRAVWLPYDGKEIAMFVVAPGERQGPTAVAEALKRKSLGALMAETQKKLAQTVLENDLLKKLQPNSPFAKRSSGYIETKQLLARSRGPAK